MFAHAKINRLPLEKMERYGWQEKRYICILVVVHHGLYCFDDGLFFVIRRHLKEYTGLTVYEHAACSIDNVLFINVGDAWSNYRASCCFKLGSIGFKDV